MYRALGLLASLTFHCSRTRLARQTSVHVFLSVEIDRANVRAKAWQAFRRLTISTSLTAVSFGKVMIIHG